MTDLSEVVDFIISLVRTIVLLIKGLILATVGQPETAHASNFPMPTKPATNWNKKASAVDPNYATLNGLTDANAFGETKTDIKTDMGSGTNASKFQLPKSPTDPSQKFVKANSRDPNYATLTLVQNIEFEDKKKKV